jgi:hypothetical protein
MPVSLKYQIVFSIILLVMIISIPTALADLKENEPKEGRYIFEGFHSVHIITGASRGISFGLPITFGHFWWTPFGNIDIDVQTDLCLKIDGELIEVHLDYPFLITLERFIGHGPTLLEMMSWSKPSPLEVYGFVHDIRISS